MLFQWLWFDWSKMAFEQQVSSASNYAYGFSYAAEPFGAAPQCDLNMIRDIASNRASAARDELWLLQTDSSYVRQRLTYFDEHWYDSLAE